MFSWPTPVLVLFFFSLQSIAMAITCTRGPGMPDLHSRQFVRSARSPPSPTRLHLASAVTTTAPSPPPRSHKRHRSDGDVGGERRHTVSSAVIVQSKVSSSSSGKHGSTRSTPSRSSSLKRHSKDRTPKLTDDAHHRERSARTVRSLEKKPADRSHREGHRRSKTEGSSHHASPSLSSSGRSSRGYEVSHASHRHLSPEWELRHGMVERQRYRSPPVASRSGRHVDTWRDPRYISESEYHRHSGRQYEHQDAVLRGRGDWVPPPHDRHGYPGHHERPVHVSEYESPRYRHAHRSQPSSHSHPRTIDGRSHPPPSSSHAHRSHHRRHERAPPASRHAEERARHAEERARHKRRHEESRQAKDQRRSSHQKKERKALPSEEVVFSSPASHDEEEYSSNDESTSPIRSPLHSSSCDEGVEGDYTEEERTEGEDDEGSVGSDRSGSESSSEESSSEYEGSSSGSFRSVSEERAKSSSFLCHWPLFSFGREFKMFQ